VQSVCNQIIVKEGLSHTPPLDKFDKDKNHLVVWDDLVLSKDLSMVENYYIRARKLNVSVIFISQSYYRIPKIIRNNCSYMVLLKLSGEREVNMILKEFALGVTKEELIEIYEYATKEKFSDQLYNNITFKLLYIKLYIHINYSTSHLNMRYGLRQLDRCIHIRQET